MIDWKQFKHHSRRKYNLYLLSDEWGALREAVLKRCGQRCEKCERIVPLEVHHIIYDRRYFEHLDDLIALCRPCHQRRHGYLSELEWHEQIYDEVPLEQPPLNDDGLPAIYSVRCAECGALDCDFIGHSKPNVFCDSCAVKLDDRRRGDVA